MDGGAVVFIANFTTIELLHTNLKEKTSLLQKEYCHL